MLRFMACSYSGNPAILRQLKALWKEFTWISRVKEKTRVSYLHTGRHLSKKLIMKTSDNRSYLFEVAAAITLSFQSLCPLCLVTCEREVSVLMELLQCSSLWILFNIDSLMLSSVPQILVLCFHSVPSAAQNWINPPSFPRYPVLST